MKKYVFINDTNPQVQRQHSTQYKMQKKKNGIKAKNNRIIAPGGDACNKYKSEMQKHLNFN